MNTPGAEAPSVVLTIGHSTRTLAEFIDLLQAHHVTQVVDVRTMPRSGQNPQFNKESLPAALWLAGLLYQHVAGLGGLRHTSADSQNTVWRNLSFRGYADHMQTPEFEENLRALMDLAGKERVALMCAEAVPWRCHRSLIADALVAHGHGVEHILSAGQCRKHTLAPWALVKGLRVTYPPAVKSEPDRSPGLQARRS